MNLSTPSKVARSASNRLDLSPKRAEFARGLHDLRFVGGDRQVEAILCAAFRNS